MKLFLALISLIAFTGTLLVLSVVIDAYLQNDVHPDPVANGKLEAVVKPVDNAAKAARDASLREQAAEARIAATQKQFESEHTRSLSLAHDLETVREQIARTFQDRVIKGDRRDAEEVALIRERIRHAADPEMGDDDMLPMAVRLRVGPTQASQPSETADRVSSDPLNSPASEAREREAVSQDQHSIADDISVAALPPLAPVTGIPELAALPHGVQARVIVEYPRGSEAARSRALALGRALRAEGINTADPVDVPTMISNGRVTYFYQSDRASAERVAELSINSPPIRGRLPAKGRVPRPGTIEVAVVDK